MQKAKMVLSILNQKSKQGENYEFDRLYRNLFNEDFYLEAYRKIYAKEGNLTEGTDGKTIDGFGKKLISELIQEMKTERYYPQPARRTYIPKKNGKMRPLGIPSFRDKLVQEIVREILEAIYEPTFLDTSHGFRPNKSCHTALYETKLQFNGAVWMIEGDITGCFDNIDHEILLRILATKIKDGRFIELIRRFLKAGYLEFDTPHNTLSGTPQGALCSPILANIYLHELDTFMVSLCERYNKGKQRKSNPEYDKLVQARHRAKREGDKEKANFILKQMRQIPSKDQMDSEYARIRYVRYADDFLIGVIGDKNMAVTVKKEVAEFLKTNLALELSQEKTLITNLRENRVHFLGYEITKAHNDRKITVASDGISRRSVNGSIQLLVPYSVIQEKIKPFTTNGQPSAHRARVNMPVLDMINQYNAEIRGLYNYYALAGDVSRKMGKFRYYHYYSLAKTIAQKEGSSVKKVIARYGIDVSRKKGTGTRRVIGVSYNTKMGTKMMTYFNESLKHKKCPNINVIDRYATPITRGCQLIQRLNANQCELCGGTTGEFAVHHVRKLKDLKTKYAKRGANVPTWVLQMCRMNRKTLVLCTDCHTKLHNGKV